VAESSAMLESIKRRIVARFWSRAIQGGGVHTWMAEPAVRRYINERVSGSPDGWPTDWLKSILSEPLDECLSLGSGDGALERDLRRKNIVRRITGLDLADGALAVAREAAARDGLDGIDYVKGDMNAPDVGEARFDAVFFHQALHHVSRLEQCLDAIAKSLKPGGMLYLDEYVGPSRHEWRKERLADAQRVYETLPPNMRRRRRLQLPVDWRDPSEAIRSSEIMGCVRERFDVEHDRGYGGNLLSVTYPHLDFSRSSEDERNAVLRAIIDAETALLDDGVPSYYAVIVARPRH